MWVWKWVQGIQVYLSYPTFIWKPKIAILGTRYTLYLARGTGRQNSLNKCKNGQFGCFFPLWGSCMVKIIINFVWNEFQEVWAQKLLIKKIFNFRLKNNDFSKKNSKGPVIPLIEPRNSVEWVSHMVLAVNQWIRPKNDGWQKCTQNVSKCRDIVS